MHFLYDIVVKHSRDIKILIVLVTVSPQAENFPGILNTSGNRVMTDQYRMICPFVFQQIYQLMAPLLIDLFELQLTKQLCFYRCRPYPEAEVMDAFTQALVEVFCLSGNTIYLLRCTVKLSVFLPLVKIILWQDIIHFQ